MLDKSLSTFKASIMALSRGVYTGVLTSFEGADALFSAVGRGYEQAFTEGQKACGIKADERTEEESAELTRLIGDNYQYVGRYIEWVVAHNKASGSPFEMIKARAQLWVNRYVEVKNIAISLSCGNKKYRWQIDGGEHCRTCLKLNGRIARASTWAAHNIAPRMITDRLRCNGYNCKCFWVETDAPATRGRWPNLP